MMHHVVTKCVRCSKDTYLLVRQVSNLGSGPTPPTILKRLAIPELVHQYPIPMPIKHEAVQADVKAAAEEAHKCLSVRAYNACGVMLRRAIHCLCQDKKAAGKDLLMQLADLKVKQVITPDLWEWAEELRVLGKHGAHPEWIDVTAEDAEYGMKFLEDIIKYVYINPHDLSKRRVKATSVKKP